MKFEAMETEDIPKRIFKPLPQVQRRKQALNRSHASNMKTEEECIHGKRKGALHGNSRHCKVCRVNNGWNTGAECIGGSDAAAVLGISPFRTGRRICC